MQDASQIRHSGLGDLAVFPDDLICRVLECLDLGSILALAATSKFLRVFCLEEPLWQTYALDLSEGSLAWRGNWQKTALALIDEKPGGVDIPERVLQNGVGEVFPVLDFSSLELYKRWYRCNMDVERFDPPSCSIERVDGRSILPEMFFECFDRLGKPALIDDLQTDWGAMRWTLNGLEEKFGELRFSINCPGKTSVKMELKNFLRYMEVQHDENPLYLFDGEFGESCPEMLQDYRVPSIFPEDFFNKLATSRPPYRWVLIGPPRSGSIWHIDPTATSAWNSLISGRKRWALYPPGTVPPGVEFTSLPHPACQDMDFQSPSALFWFLEIYPNLDPTERPIEFLQQPGETVFIPSGWWHCVLNLETSVAITQNFVSRANLKEVVGCLARGAFRYHLRLYGEDEVGEEEKEQLMNEGGAAAEGLSVVGCRWLGQWMTRLWREETHADVKDILWESGCEYFNAQMWLSILMSACLDLDLGKPKKYEALPLTATSNWVFRVGDSIIKVYVNEVEMKGMLQSVVEELLLQSMTNSTVVEKGWVPKLKGTHNADLRLPHSKLKSPMLSTSLCEGKSLSDCFQRLSALHLIQVATETGKILAHIHTIPMQSSTEFMPFSKETDTVLFRDSAPMSDWLKSQIHDGTFWQAQDPTIAWSSAEGEIRILMRDGAPCTATIKHQNEVRRGFGPWYPFVSFLRWRRATVVEHHKKSGSMPNHLMHELDAYLPEDPSLLVEASPRFDPCWLHGDMTHDNILTTLDDKPHKNGVIPAEPPQENGAFNPPVTVIDFGDAGHGDALYDFVAVAISSLKCKEDLMAPFLDSYLRNRGVLGGEPMVFSNRSISLSKIAMCYTLLHEDSAVRRVFELRPELRKSQTLDEVQVKFWGFLDKCVTNNHPC
ncbi:hypothetical protein BSKO_06910 [Bryopsis sp. KO-2023]|nr:hypothetical protein BSKO_06910 [Bryopsis sp. KO-2023]